GALGKNTVAALQAGIVIGFVDQIDALVDRLRARIQEFYGPTPAAQRQSDDYARLVHGDHYDAVVGLLTDALERGATIAAGGHHDAATNYVAPTVLTDVPADSRILQEEIFGPLLPVRSYSTLDEAVDFINERPAPLSLYLFTERDATVDTILNRTSAGSTCINEGFLHFANPGLPFGGKGESGIGRGSGRRGFRAFSNERAVLRRTYGSDWLRLLYPPYDGFTSRLTDLIRRYV
ncbi:MAG: aldehyde dehydrogenase family protein, partial [Salinibacter sp.]